MDMSHGDLTTCGSHETYMGKLECAQRVVKYCRDISKICGPTKWRLNPIPHFDEQILREVRSIAPAKSLKEGDLVRFGSGPDIKYGTITSINHDQVTIEADDDKGVFVKVQTRNVFNVYLKGLIKLCS